MLDYLCVKFWNSRKIGYGKAWQKNKRIGKETEPSIHLNYSFHKSFQCIAETNSLGNHILGLCNFPSKGVLFIYTFILANFVKYFLNGLFWIT